MNKEIPPEAHYVPFTSRWQMLWFIIAANLPCVVSMLAGTILMLNGYTYGFLMYIFTVLTYRHFYAVNVPLQEDKTEDSE